MKKIKVLPSILMLIACIAILGVGVFAVAPTQNTISGSITINSANPEIIISAYFHNEDGTINTESPIIENARVRSGIDIDLDTLEFDTSNCNSVEDLANLAKKVTIKIQNPTTTKLGVFFSENKVTTTSTAGDILTTKSLMAENGQNDIVSATLSGYLTLSSKAGENNGVVEATIEFNLLKFIDTNTSIDLSEDDNKIYLNIEEHNPAMDLPENKEPGTITLDTGNTPVSVELLIDGESQGEAETVNTTKTFNIEPFVWDTLNVSSIDELEEKRITFKIQNLSTTQSLGAYFFKNGSTVANDNLATGQNIMLEEFMYADDSEISEENKVASVSCTPYMYIAKYDDEITDGNTVFDTIEMTIRFNAYQLFGSTKTATINYKLNIEPYEPNISAVENDKGLPVISPGTITTAVEQGEEGRTQPPIVTIETSGFSQSLLKLPEENYTTIKAASFYGNTNIEHIVVPSNVTTLELVETRYDWHNCGYGNLGFSCANLKAVSWCADVVSDISAIRTNNLDGFFPWGDGVISQTNEGVVLSINAPRIQTYKAYSISSGYDQAFPLFESCSISKLYLINVNAIGDNFDGYEESSAFGSCESLVKIEIPSSVTNIGKGAFYKCSGLTSIEIPSSVTSIGSLAFYKCSGLTSITIKCDVDLTEAYTLPTLSKTGYTFKGWYDNPQGNGEHVEEISAEPYAEDITYYAVWTKDD